MNKQQNKEKDIPYVDTISAVSRDFGIGEWTIRQWVKQKQFPVIMAGRKTLINYDVFKAFLNGEIEQKGEEKST